MKRITVITENKTGALANIVRVLADANININTLNAETKIEGGVVVLMADDGDKALRVLQVAGFKAVTDDILLIRLKDEPGALAKIAARFKKGGVNIRSIHIVEHRKSHATVALSTDDLQRAKALVADELIL